jgi:membrane protein involved in colicin uptake
VCIWRAMTQQRRRDAAAKADALAEGQRRRLLAKEAAAEGARREGEARRAEAEAARRAEDGTRERLRAEAKARAEADERAKRVYYEVPSNPLVLSTLLLVLHAHAMRLMTARHAASAAASRTLQTPQCKAEHSAQSTGTIEFHALTPHGCPRLLWHMQSAPGKRGQTGVHARAV